MVFSLKFSNRDIEAWVIVVDSVEVTFEATAVSEPAITLSTGDHGVGEGSLEVGDGICGRRRRRHTGSEQMGLR